MTKEELLETVKNTICGERQDDYGNQENSFQQIADYWNIYLDQHNCIDKKITPIDVAQMMVLLKIARGNTKVDNFVDSAGYSVLGASLIHNNRTVEPVLNAVEKPKTGYNPPRFPDTQ